MASTAPPEGDAVLAITGNAGAIEATVVTLFVRPVLWLAFLVGLLWVGMNTLYVGNPTFGAHPPDDYLGLVLWGLGSNVTSATLSSLGTLRGGAGGAPAAPPQAP